jgi:hypothetical protein
MTTFVKVRAPGHGRHLVIWFAVACVAALALRVIYVHDKSWEYRLVPSSTPPKVGFHDRDYSRGADLETVDTGFVRSGQTMGGGVIYAPTGYPTATVIDVVDGHRVVEYSLMGGP